VYSVTELEKAAECPFRFFLKRGLGVRPIDERERDRDIWLDPLTRGSELHELYAALLRRARDENRRPNKKDGIWLIALAQEHLRKLNEEMPAATVEILERESKDFLADVELFKVLTPMHHTIFSLRFIAGVFTALITLSSSRSSSSFTVD